MSRTMRLLPVFLVAVLALTLGMVSRGEAKRFEEREVFIEINATDGDAGFQGIVDGDPWRRLRLFGPDFQKLFDVEVGGSLEEQGLTEFHWESGEPEFDELPLEDFLARFPEGNYLFFANTIDGGGLLGRAELTHHLPDGPEITAPTANQVVDPDVDLVVMWNAVTTQFNEDGIGTGDPLEGPIVKYSVTVETDDDGDDDKVMNFDVLPDNPAGPFSATIPADFLDPDRGWKVEIGAFEESGNSTFRELPFCTHDLPECPEEDEE